MGSEIVDQPPPLPNGHPGIQALVRVDLEERERLGIERYGTQLQPFNGRDALVDAYQEALDLVCYLRQVIAERSTEGGDGSGLAPEASNDRPSAATGDRTGAPEGDALSRVVDDVSERVYRQWQVTPNRDAYAAAVVRQACQEAVTATRPLIQAAALRAYAERVHGDCPCGERVVLLAAADRIEGTR
jgi:hypothetical protein